MSPSRSEVGAVADRPDLQAGFAIGDRRQHRIGEVVGHLRKRQRQDREIDARPPQRHIADQKREHAGKDDRQCQCRHHVHGEQLERPDRRIGADPDECGVAEGQVSGQAEQDVEADGEDPEDRELLQKVGIGRAEWLQCPGAGEDDGRKADQAAASRWMRPRHLILVKVLSMVLVLHHAFAAHQAARQCQQHDDRDEVDDDLVDSGQDGLTSFIEAKDCRTPSRKPAATAPASEPMPPTTTTTKDRTRKSMPQ